MATYYWVGGSGTWDNSSKTNWSTSSGGAGGSGPPVAADTVNFDANSGTAATVTVAATAACTTCTINKSDINLSLSGSPTFGGIMTLTTGTITLGSNTLTVAQLASNNSNVRTIDFGTGKIVVSGGNGTVWNFQTNTNIVISGTPVVDFTYSGSTGTRTIANGNVAGGSASNAISINIKSGTDTAAVGGFWNTVDFSGFAGTLTGSRTIYGDWTLSTGMTVGAASTATTFAGTSKTQKITSNGKTMDFPLTFNGANTTFAFQDAFTQGSTRAFTITNGTVQLKAGATTTVGALTTSGTNQKVLQSTSAGSQATLSQASGNANLQYLTVKDIAATGGAKFNALNNCITQGNNSGWYFAPQLGRPLPSFAF